jgi:hypothetical protein
MAGDWIKLQKDTPDKPEVLAIASRLGLDPDAVVGKLVRIWSWFDTHTVNGNASCVTFSFLDRITGVTGFAEQVALIGWLEQDGHNLSLPNFEYHNGETAKQRALSKNRVEKARSYANCNATSVTKPLPEKRREEKRREDINTEIQAPEGVSIQTWQDFKKLRKTMRAAITQSAIDGIKREADKAGWSLEDALRECCARGWRGFKAEWTKEKRTGYLPPQPNETTPAKPGIDPTLAKLNEEAKYTKPPSAEMRAKLDALKQGRIQ